MADEAGEAGCKTKELEVMDRNALFNTRHRAIARAIECDVQLSGSINFRTMSVIDTILVLTQTLKQTGKSQVHMAVKHLPGLVVTELFRLMKSGAISDFKCLLTMPQEGIPDIIYRQCYQSNHNMNLVVITNENHSVSIHNLISYQESPMSGIMSFDKNAAKFHIDTIHQIILGDYV